MRSIEIDAQADRLPLPPNSPLLGTMTIEQPAPSPQTSVQIGPYQAITQPGGFQLQSFSTDQVYRFAGAGMPTSSISEPMVDLVTSYIAEWEHLVSPNERSGAMSFREVWQEAADYFEAIEGIAEGRRG
ncbi:hypothetical protein H6G51_08415 [Limnothrix sp. FACHB-708]|uniref:hypothetical protein n=2 Tax=unclassified Limnothrix TaxID=2632864 RepID=UPI00168622B6|nr:MULTISPECIES: hypothetical protein [unclassified Limnothrix]MBD2553300.1 hypothetical protein [Limnothrix sp. FACHB-708]MBD2590676.1 hypothetical protein [Limnothrix sp. FACHB-406]